MKKENSPQEAASATTKILATLITVLALMLLCLNVKSQLGQFNDGWPGGGGNNTPISTGTFTNFGGTNGPYPGQYTGTNYQATNIVLLPHTSTNYFTSVAVHQGIGGPNGPLGGTGLSIFPIVYALSNATGSVIWELDPNIDGRQGSYFTSTEPITYTQSMVAANLNGTTYTNTNGFVGYWNIAASNLWNSDWLLLSVTNASSNTLVLIGARWSYNMPQ